jgi:hypothetical protein
MDPYLNSYEYLYGGAFTDTKENSKTLFLANEASRNNWNFNRQLQTDMSRNPEPYYNRKTESKPSPFGNKFSSNSNSKKK